MKLVVIAATVLLAALVLFAARALPQVVHATTASHRTQVTAHETGSISAQQAIAAANPAVAPFYGGNATTIQGVTAQYLTTAQLDQMAQATPAYLPNESNWWVVSYPGIVLTSEDPNHLVNPSAPATLTTGGHMSVIVDPMTGAALGEFTW